MLELFRQQQERADQAALADGEEAAGGGAGSPILAPADAENWGVAGKKRKKGPGRDKEGVLKGVKIRRKSSSAREDQAFDGNTGMAERKQSVNGKARTSSLPASSSTTSGPINPNPAGEEPPSEKASQSTATMKLPPKGILGLNYDSDSDE